MSSCDPPGTSPPNTSMPKSQCRKRQKLFCPISGYGDRLEGDLEAFLAKGRTALSRSQQDPAFTVRCESSQHGPHRANYPRRSRRQPKVRSTSPYVPHSRWQRPRDRRRPADRRVRLRPPLRRVRDLQRASHEIVAGRLSTPVPLEGRRTNWISLPTRSTAWWRIRGASQRRRRE